MPEALYTRARRSGLRSSKRIIRHRLRGGRRARASKAAPRALESRDEIIDVDDEGRPGVLWFVGPGVVSGARSPNSAQG